MRFSLFPPPAGVGIDFLSLNAELAVCKYNILYKLFARNELLFLFLSKPPRLLFYCQHLECTFEINIVITLLSAAPYSDKVVLAVNPFQKDLMKKQLLVGIVGQPLAGKDELGRQLQTHHGFREVSSSDRLRKHMASFNLGDPTPENMNSVSTGLRRDYGADFLVRWILNESPLITRLSISGLRLVGEIETLKSLGGIVVAVTAPQRIRFERRTLRNRLGDDLTWEQFVEFEKLESESTDPLRHNVNAVIKLADYVLVNDSDVGTFRHNVDVFAEWLEKLPK
jgi:dephospho-CoA kinase